MCATRYWDMYGKILHKKILKYHVNDLPTSLHMKSMNKVHYVCIYTYINAYTYRNYKKLDVDNPLHQKTFSPPSSKILVLLYTHTPIEASRFLLKSAWSRIPGTSIETALISVLILCIVQSLPVIHGQFKSVLRNQCIFLLSICV